MPEEDFIGGKYGMNLHNPLDDDRIEEYFWTLGEREPDEIDSFIDLQINEEDDEIFEDTE